MAEMEDAKAIRFKQFIRSDQHLLRAGGGIVRPAFKKEKLNSMNISDYQPIDGFYDLRAFDIPAKEFKKLWGVQKFLSEVETQRRQGKIHPQINEIRNFSADYQQALSQYKVVRPELF